MLLEFLKQLDFGQISPAFMFLIAIIDPLGNIPVTINMEKNGIVIHPFRVCLYSFVILLTFFLASDFLLWLFDIRIEYFAIAGGFVIFLMAIEMLLDVVFFKSSDLGVSGDLVPLAFPMYAGPGTFTALISISALYSVVNLLVTLVLCMVFLYIVLKGTNWLVKHLNLVSMYVIRKFFGIIVLAIAVQLIFGNLVKIFKDPDKSKQPSEQAYLGEDMLQNDIRSGSTYCPPCWI